MYGPSRKVMGGISTVVNFYYTAWNEDYKLTYVPTMEDGSKLRKAWVFLLAFLKSLFVMPAYDVVHVHMASKNSYNRKSIILGMARFYGKKTVIHVHGANFMEFYNDYSTDSKRRHIKRTFDLSDHVIALSKAWKNKLETITETPITVLYNAVPEPTAFEGRVKKQICFLGRLGVRKGVYDLLESVKHLNEKYNDYEVFIGGDGDVDGVKSYIASNYLNNVHYVGWISGSDKEALLRESMFFALPSYHEGLPMALLEAMSYGCIPITTRVGGIPEVIEDGENGFLMDAGDTERLYGILDELLSQQHDVKKIAENATKTIARDYSINEVITGLYRVYDALN